MNLQSAQRNILIVQENIKIKILCFFQRMDVLQNNSTRKSISIPKLYPSKYQNSHAMFISTPDIKYSLCIQKYLSEITNEFTPELLQLYVFCDQHSSYGYTNLMKTDPFFSNSVASIFTDMATNDMICKLEYILKRHKKIQKKSKNNEHRIYIIIENLNDQVLFLSNVFNDIIRNGKIWKAFMILHQQFDNLPCEINGKIKDIQYTFVSHTKNKDYKKKISNIYKWLFPMPFLELFDKITRDGDWMVINTHTWTPMESAYYYTHE